jgi:ACS family pantothenate transporter-like MFS transporter
MAEIPEAVPWTPPAIDNEKKQLGHSISKSHVDSHSSEASDSGSPKPWEKPGFQAKAHRTWRSIQRYIWDDPDKPAIEKKFLLKLDFFLLTYTCLGYFCKNLDQANISNAYVSGMKEALNMGGSELTYMGNVFTAGYVVGQLPAVILATKVRPSIMVSTLEILWAVFTFCCASVKTVPQLYALRFLVGLCEGAFFPVIIYLISSWCKSSPSSISVPFQLQYSNTKQTQKSSAASESPFSTQPPQWRGCSVDISKQLRTRT